MLVEIEGLLQEAQLRKIDEVLSQAEFVDGKLTAGKAASRVKNNEELKGEPRQMELLIRILTSAMAHNATFRSAVLPYRMADPIFARYQPGMTYGDHVDDPLMGLSGQRFRSDVSMTVFLREPETYAGGELVVRTTFDDGVSARARDLRRRRTGGAHHLRRETGQAARRQRGDLSLFEPAPRGRGDAGRAPGGLGLDTELRA